MVERQVELLQKERSKSLCSAATPSEEFSKVHCEQLLEPSEGVPPVEEDPPSSLVPSSTTDTNTDSEVKLYKIKKQFLQSIIGSIHLMYVRVKL